MVLAQALGVGGGDEVHVACKGGIIALSKTMAREMARRGVTLNVVCPGPRDTPLSAMEAGCVAAVSGSLQPILLGGMAMFLMVAEPDGLNKRWNDVEDCFRAWPFPYE